MPRQNLHTEANTSARQGSKLAQQGWYLRLWRSTCHFPADWDRVPCTPRQLLVNYSKFEFLLLWLFPPQFLTLFHQQVPFSALSLARNTRYLPASHVLLSLLVFPRPYHHDHTGQPNSRNSSTLWSLFCSPPADALGGKRCNSKNSNLLEITRSWIGVQGVLSRCAEYSASACRKIARRPR